MEVIGYDIKPCLESGMKFMTKEEVLAKADYISVHTGGKDAVIGEKEFALMKPSAYVINTSRGSNMDSQRSTRRLKKAKSQVPQPTSIRKNPKTKALQFTDKLRELGNVVMSSHLGASTAGGTAGNLNRDCQGRFRLPFGRRLHQRRDAGESIEVEEKPVHTLVHSPPRCARSVCKHRQSLC